MFLHEELYVLTQLNIIYNRVVIQTVVGHKINHEEGHERVKGICPSLHRDIHGPIDM